MLKNLFVGNYPVRESPTPFIGNFLIASLNKWFIISITNSLGLPWTTEGEMDLLGSQVSGEETCEPLFKHSKHTGSGIGILFSNSRGVQ